MLAKAEEIEERLQGAADPLKRAIQYAMTGNYIDFGAMQKVEEEQLERLLEKSQEIVVDPKEYEALRRELLAGRNVVYLTDNCGEIVLDKLLMKEILRQNPQARITAIVRGAPALNDATVEDAQQVGLSQVARVIGNGSAIARWASADSIRRRRRRRKSRESAEDRAWAISVAQATPATPI